MIDEQSSASGQDYASDRSAIGADPGAQETEAHDQVLLNVLRPLSARSLLAKLGRAHDQEIGYSDNV